MEKVKLKNYKKPKMKKVRLVIWLVISRLFFETRLPWPNAIKRGILILFGARVGKFVILKPNIKIKQPWLLRIEDYSWIGEGVWVDNPVLVEIGPNCCLSQGALVETGNHDYRSGSFRLLAKQIKLSDGCWVGAKATVCSGVVMGSHSILTAGSTLTINTKPYWIYQGNPARPKRKRVVKN